MQKLRLLWDRLGSSFWFLPSLMVTASMACALLFIEADNVGVTQSLNLWPGFFNTEAEGARLMLSTLAGSMMTIMGITFSMTLLALVLASGQYSSRILRNFMRSRVTQSTLGVFASIFVYCLIVLRTVKGHTLVQDDNFVPVLAVFFAFLMSIVGVIVLIYFIHHIASSIQASSIIASVAQETNDAVDRLFPLKAEHNHHDEMEKHDIAILDERSWYPVLAPSSGYLQDINLDTLLKVAASHKTIVKMERGIGEFAVKDTPLVSVALTYPPQHRMEKEVIAAYSISRHRTVEQDPAFGIRQIVDMAIKALSPGVNDTSTAIMCIDYLSSIISRLAGRQLAAKYYSISNRLRLIVIAPGFEHLLGEAFNQIRSNAQGNMAILARILNALAIIAAFTHQRDYLLALTEQLERIAELSTQSLTCKHERKHINGLLTLVKQTLQQQNKETQ